MGKGVMQNNEKLPRDGPILVKMFVHYYIIRK